MRVKIDRDYLTNTLIDLVKINSINPTLVPGGAGEAEIAGYVSQTLRALGLEVTNHEPEPGRVSVVGRLRGTGQGRSLMLNGHIDTVGIDDMPDPFSAKIQDGKLYGRGAFDMKGSVAACITAIKALIDVGMLPKGDLLISAVADEEYASIGSADIVQKYKVDGAIVAEPTTNMSLCLAHKGFVWLEVETIGRAAHGSRFNEGIDANMHMGRFLAELDKLERRLRTQTGHPRVGPPSLHAAILKGGTQLSAYAARCQLNIERRTIPGETETQVIDEVQTIIDGLAADDPTFKARVASLFVREPFEVSPEATIVQAVEKAATAISGQAPTRIGETFWADAALFSATGIETVMIGPKGAGAHAKEEWVDIQSLVDLAHILAETALEYCC